MILACDQHDYTGPRPLALPAPLPPSDHLGPMHPQPCSRPASPSTSRRQRRRRQCDNRVTLSPQLPSPTRVYPLHFVPTLVLVSTPLTSLSSPSPASPPFHLHPGPRPRCDNDDSAIIALSPSFHCPALASPHVLLFTDDFRNIKLITAKVWRTRDRSSQRTNLPVRHACRHGQRRSEANHEPILLG